MVVYCIQCDVFLESIILQHFGNYSFWAENFDKIVPLMEYFTVKRLVLVAFISEPLLVYGLAASYVVIPRRSLWMIH